MKAIRGAITVEGNTVSDMRSATLQLLETIVKENHLQQQDLVQVVFSATKDLDAAYPAKFAREIGWTDVPLFCVQEMAVVGSLPMCLRVMIAVNHNEAVKHVYLKDAQSLRPDLLS